MKSKLLKKIVLMLTVSLCMSAIVGCGQTHTTEISLSEDKEENSEDEESNIGEDEERDSAIADTETSGSEDEMLETTDSAEDEVLATVKSSLVQSDEFFHRKVEEYMEDCSYEYNAYKIGDGLLIIAKGYGIDSMTYAFYTNGTEVVSKCICPVARSYETIYPEEDRIIVYGSDGAASSSIEIYNLKLQQLYYFYQDASNGTPIYEGVGGTSLTKENVEDELRQCCDGLVSYDECGLFLPNYEGTSMTELDSYFMSTAATMEEILAMCKYVM